jgi:hypothetical protein
VFLYKIAPWIVSLFPDPDTMNVFFIIFLFVLGGNSCAPLILKYSTEFIKANRTWYWRSSILLIVLSIINYHWLSGFILNSISGIAAWMSPVQTSPVHTSQQMTIDWGTPDKIVPIGPELELGSQVAAHVSIVEDKKTYYVLVMPQMVSGETPWYNRIWLYIQYMPAGLFVTRYLWLLYAHEKTKRSKD